MLTSLFKILKRKGDAETNLTIAATLAIIVPHLYSIHLVVLKLLIMYFWWWLFVFKSQNWKSHKLRMAENESQCLAWLKVHETRNYTKEYVSSVAASYKHTEVFVVEFTFELLDCVVHRCFSLAFACRSRVCFLIQLQFKFWFLNMLDGCTALLFSKFKELHASDFFEDALHITYLEVLLGF